MTGVAFLARRDGFGLGANMVIGGVNSQSAAASELDDKCPEKKSPAAGRASG
jgi:hypothetical protein